MGGEILATNWHAYCANNLIPIEHCFPSNVMIICVFVVENPVCGVNVFLFIFWLSYYAINFIFSTVSFDSVF